MFIRIIIFNFITAVYFITPRFFYSDFLEECDWVVILCMLIGVLIYAYKKSIKGVWLLSLILSINTLVYFLITARESIPDVGDPRIFYRVIVIAGLSSPIADSWGYLIEQVNYIQVFFSIMLVISLMILCLIQKRKSHTLKNIRKSAT